MDLLDLRVQKASEGQNIGNIKLPQSILAPEGRNRSFL
jgi:hypothetical protein